MTFVGRVAERANRRRKRRQRIRAAVASLCVIAGVVLVVVLEFRSSDRGAASLSASKTRSPTRSSTPTRPAAVTTPVTLPIGGTGSTLDPSAASFDDPSIVTSVLGAAKTGIEAVDSYDYRDLGSAIQTGLAVTAGQFQTSYRTAMTGPVASQAPASKTVQQCTIQKLGIASLSTDGGSATVLALGRLETTDTTTGTTPRETPITLDVTLVNVTGEWLISGVTDMSTATMQTEPPGNGSLIAATRVGAQEVLNLLSFTRANYAGDFGRALALLTGPLLAEQEGQRTSILTTMTSAGMDYAGVVRAVGIENVSDNSVTLLVAASSYQVDAAGKKTLATLPEVEVGVVRVNGTWLVDQFLAVSTS